MFGIIGHLDDLDTTTIHGLEICSQRTTFLFLTFLGLIGFAKWRATPEKEALSDLPIPVSMPRCKTKKLIAKKRICVCSSDLHRPGACHGFDVYHHMKAGKTGSWSLFQGSNAVQLKTGPEQQKEVLQTLALATLAAAFIMVVELACGFHFRSLALLSEAVHQLSDVALYVGLLFAAKLADSNADKRFSYGFGRAQVLGTFTALLFQYFLTGLLLVGAAQSLLSSQSAEDFSETGPEVFATGAFALSLNMLLLWALPTGSHDHNHGAAHSLGAAYVARLHLLGDLMQGCSVLVSGLLRWFEPSFYWVDAASVFVHAALVVALSRQVFCSLLCCLMEGTPESVDANAIFEDLGSISDVIDVHCFHIWTIGPEKVSLSAHLHIGDDVHEDVLHAAQILLKHKYGIAHSTLQISSDEDLA